MKNATAMVEETSRFVNQYLRKHPPPEEMMLMGTALVVGLGAGFGAVIFRWLIFFFQKVFFRGANRFFPFWAQAISFLFPPLAG